MLAMEKRSAARELAFLALFQLPQKTENLNLKKLAKTDLQAICLSAVRTLADFSRDNLKQAESAFIKVERYVLEHQISHPDNEQFIESKSVPLPQTEEFIKHLNECYESISYVREALQVPELYWHYRDKSVEDFTISLLTNYIDNLEEIDALITEVTKTWDIKRIHKTEKALIRLATSEMFSSNIAHEIVVSEILKLANKYCPAEAPKFINGVLADVIKQLKEVKEPC